jgi:uncharacterized membrane protein
MPEPNIPDHIQQTIDAIAELHARHLREATRVQRVVEQTVRWVGRPLMIGYLTIAIIGWVAVNLVLNADGRAFDPPPFQILQDIGEVIAIYITVLILMTTQREKEIGEHREQLTLELAMLSEQKSAKIIQLIEESRRDNPMINDRVDSEAAAFSVPADPQAVLDAIKDSHQEMRVSVDTGRSK